MSRCYCPDDCGCRRAYRVNYCGCRCIIVCKVCNMNEASLPVGAPDMCRDCESAAWARIDAKAALMPANPPFSNGWD